MTPPMGWVPAGHWIDLAEDALTMQRPKLDAMLTAMREGVRRREVLCLVHDWGRVASDDSYWLALQTRIAEAGGWTSATLGESDHRGHTGLLGRRP